MRNAKANRLTTRLSQIGQLSQDGRTLFTEQAEGGDGPMAR